VVSPVFSFRFLYPPSWLALLVCGLTAIASHAQHAPPPGFPTPLDPADNPLSEAKAVLGCLLFFEPRLSVTGEQSCASCHRPQLAFTDGRARSVGATGEALARGAMTLTNVAYNAAFTWANDQVVTLEQQMEQPLFSAHPVEMGVKREDSALLEWLAHDGRYSSAFTSAFPSESTAISMQNVIKAIAAFERTLISGRSAFDRYVYDDDRAALSVTAKRGMDLFFSDRTGCARCHFGVNFSGALRHRAAADAVATFAGNGLAHDDRARVLDADHGLMYVTHRERDRGRFRVPTLRNIELTAPYMHDGRFGTLEAVIDHYVSGGQAHGVREVEAAIRPLDLTADEKQALIVFLRSLTDAEFVKRDWAACVIK
jgi:cytochrome c peroxidase